MKGKKAQESFGLLYTIIISIIIIGFIIGVGFLVIAEFKGNISDETATVINETIQFKTVGTYATKNYTTSEINCYNNFNIIIVTNESGGIVINPGNYSYDSNGKVWNLTGEYPSRLWNVTYTYNYGKEACGGIETTLENLSDIPTWLTIILIIAIVGVLLAIVFMVLPRRETTIAEI